MHPLDRMDVNITPDKRQIMISEEKIMLAIIKVSYDRQTN